MHRNRTVYAVNKRLILIFCILSDRSVLNGNERCLHKRYELTKFRKEIFLFNVSMGYCSLTARCGLFGRTVLCPRGETGDTYP